MKTAIAALAIGLVSKTAWADDAPRDEAERIRAEADELRAKDDLAEARFRLEHGDEIRRDKLENQRSRARAERAISEPTGGDAFVRKRVFFQRIVGIGYGTGFTSEGVVALHRSDRLVAVHVWPGVDVRIGDHLTVGGSVGIGTLSHDSRTESTIGVHPRIGYLASLGKAGALWPQLSVGVTHVESTEPSGYLFFTRIEGPIGRASSSVSAQAELAWTTPLSSYVHFQLVPRLTFAHKVETDKYEAEVGLSGRLGLSF
jgi:hypothetical protein